MSTPLKLVALLASGQTDKEAIKKHLDISEDTFFRTLRTLRDTPPPVGKGYGMDIEAQLNGRFEVRDWGIINREKLQP